MKGLALIGSTGSIGVNTLEVVDSDPGEWKIIALACGYNAQLVAQQALRYRPDLVAVADETTAAKTANLIKSYNPEIVAGENGLKKAAQADGADIVLVAVSGAAGLLPAWVAVKASKKLALATKEAMVLAGEILMAEAERSGAEILPVDSEHSAVFQLMHAVEKKDVEKIWLGASGGPFRESSIEDMQNISPKQALDHPVWQMGPRITIDSATMMNKGLEIIEACALFRVTQDRIGVFVHPQGIVHAMLEMKDGVMLAHVGRPDMKGPIAYAMYYPARTSRILDPPEFLAGVPWTFEPVDVEKFPCLKLARKAAEAGGTMPAVMNAADEVAVEAFLKEKCSFTNIPELVDAVMQKHSATPVKTPEDALAADRWARSEAEKELKNLKNARTG